MRALVTGSAGFVGSHMSRELRHRGWTVDGLDVARGPHEDVRDWFRADDGLRHYDLVVHCAAVVGGRRTIEGAPLAVAVDLAIDAELFQWAVRVKPGRVVYYSSSAAYPVRWQGRSRHIRLSEDMIDHDNPANPDLTYGWVKLTGERLAAYARDAGVPVTVIRPFSGYGPDQALDYPFPSFIDRAARRADPFDVWGDGEQVRDFVHIDDVVAATLAAVDDGTDQPINVGLGRATSFNDLAHMVTEAAGYEPEIRHQRAEPVGVHYRVADTNRLSRVFTPTISLEQGIDEALTVAARRTP